MDCCEAFPPPSLQEGEADEAASEIATPAARKDKNKAQKKTAQITLNRLF